MLGKSVTAQPQSESALPRPFSWIRTGKLAIGAFPRSAAHWHNLQQSGVAAVMSCCEPSEGVWDPPQHLASRRHPLADHRNPEAMDAPRLSQAIEGAVELYETQPALYLHCWAGIERSPLVAVGLLCRVEGLSLFEALDQVRLQHPIARPITRHLVILEALLQQRSCGD